MIPESITSYNWDGELFSDASGKIGYGAYFKGHYLSGVWERSFLSSKPSIALQEIIPIAMAIVTFSGQMANEKTVMWCDNQTVYTILNKQSSRCHRIMDYVRLIVLTRLEKNIQFKMHYVNTKVNNVCDALSRQEWSRFHRLKPPYTDPSPTEVPSYLQPN